MHLPDSDAAAAAAVAVDERTIFRMRDTGKHAARLHIACTLYTTNGNPKHKPTNRTNS